MSSSRRLALDLILVAVFTIIGRASHSEGLSLGGIWQTAWPFLIAAVIGSLAGSRLGGHSWWRQGLIVWVVTVVGGLILRLLGGQTAAPGFVAVTGVVLALFLIGWRFLLLRPRLALR